MAEEVLRDDVRKKLCLEPIHLHYESSADVFSFGLVLFFLFEGKHPYSDGKFEEITFALNRDHEAPFPKPEIPEAIPDRYKNVINGCLNSDPEDRPTFMHLMNLFETWAPPSSSSSTSTAAVSTPSIPINTASNPTSATPSTRVSQQLMEGMVFGRSAEVVSKMQGAVLGSNVRGELVPHPGLGRPGASARVVALTEPEPEQEEPPNFTIPGIYVTNLEGRWKSRIIKSVRIALISDLSIQWVKVAEYLGFGNTITAIKVSAQGDIEEQARLFLGKLEVRHVLYDTFRQALHSCNLHATLAALDKALG
jgi:serine/threonine protein kinase